MESIINENLLTFNDIEKKIFKLACETAVRITTKVLEMYDLHLMKSRDKKAYRCKGKRKTTIKTVYGEVTYQRNIYQIKDEDGQQRFVYLLDEFLELENVGMISQNLAEQLVTGITTKSYRNCAKEVSESTGQTVSHAGVWNVIQFLGKKVSEEEKELVKANKKGKLNGNRQAPVIFEESDGIYLRLQGEDRKKSKEGKAEMKVAIAYDGWKETGKNRYRLDGKVAFAGFEKSDRFHKIREAKISSVYDLDETKLRILNGDGASWIKKVPDKETVFQLDPFHRNKAVKEKIHNLKAREDVMDYLNNHDLEEMFRYLEIYKDSLSDDKEISDAEELIRYFCKNKEGLIPYQQQVKEMPECPKGLLYRNLGTMENHIWSIVAQRMKHGHRTWSKAGANNLAKILAKKCEGKLHEVTEKLKKELFVEEVVDEMIDSVLSAASIPERVGKGYEYPVRGSVVSINEALRGDSKKLFQLAGY